ncbi:MAG: RidA family protein [Geminicoccales bacterium]
MIEERLATMGIELPEAAMPVANYVPFTISGKQVFVSGQLPMRSGQVAYTGRLGDGVSIEDGEAAAALCAINLLAQAKNACGGDLAKLGRCLKLGGFVASTADFTDHPKVVNGASNLIAEAMGDAGQHARFAVGVSSLPLGAAVEVDAIFELA